MLGSLGGDLAVVNAARVSFNKQVTSLSEKDIKLIEYLAKHKHMSPFRHVQVQLLLEDVPEFVLRQVFKHQVGLGVTSSEFRESATVWNEVSGRYVEFEPKFFRPKFFRGQPKDLKQGSSGVLDAEVEVEAKAAYDTALSAAFASYQRLLTLGVCREQARAVLPICFLSSVIWTASLEALVNFVRLRTHKDAQAETRELAEVVKSIISVVAPISTNALLRA